MPSTDEFDSYVPPVVVLIADLDERYHGYVLAAPLGIRDESHPPLIKANATVDDGLITRIRDNANRLGPGETPLHHVRLAQTPRNHEPQRSDVAPLGLCQRLASGLHDILTQVSKGLDQAFDNPAAVGRLPEADVNTRLQTIRIEIDSTFQSTLETIVDAVIETGNRPTLFGCLERYEGGTLGHTLHVTLMGLKLLARHFQCKPGRPRDRKRMMQFARGLLLHDTGMLLVPEAIRTKTLRIPAGDLPAIRDALVTRGLDRRLYTTLMAVIDPRYKYKKKIEAWLKDELKKLEPLVEKGVLTREQYDALALFPAPTCLSPDERALLERHPLWGWEMAKAAGAVGPQGLDLIRHHHQRKDMSGYPPIQTDVSLPAQIACAVDIFDALVSERPHREAKSYDVAFGILDAMTTNEKGSRPQLDRAVYDLLILCIEKYPIGSFVRIVGGTHAGCVGQVVDYTPHNMDTPRIVLFRDPNGARMAAPVLLGKGAFDGSFQIQGLPFTASNVAACLRPA